jgi:hypothetical protein
VKKDNRPIVHHTKDKDRAWPGNYSRDAKLLAQVKK